MPETRVMKVEVTANVGMSVQTVHGDWIKQGTQIAVTIGPGFPEPAFLEQTLNDMTLAAYNQCATQVQLVVEKVNDDVTKAVGSGG